MKTISNKMKSLAIASMFAVSIISNNSLFANESGNGSVNISASMNGCPSCSTEAIVQENSITVENWMGSNDYWGTFDAVEVKDTDGHVTVENWMVSNDLWGTFDALEVIESENSNYVEQWMSDNVLWGTESTEMVEADNESKIEQWMSCNNYWFEGFDIDANQLEPEKPTKVESWMVDNNLWN